MISVFMLSSALAADKVDLEFAWRPDWKASVAEKVTDFSSARGHASTSSSIQVAFQIATEPATAGIRVFATGGRVVAAPSGNPAADFAAMEAQVLASPATYVVDPSGAFVGVEDAQAESKRLREQIAAWLVDADAAMQEVVGPILDTVTRPEAIADASAASWWMPYVPRGKQKIGVSHTEPGRARLPFGGATVYAPITWTVAERVACTAGGDAAGCVRLVIDVPGDRAEVTDAFRKAFPAVGADQHVEFTVHYEIVAEPATLRPWQVQAVETTKITDGTPGEPISASGHSSVQTYTWQ